MITRSRNTLGIIFVGVLCCSALAGAMSERSDRGWEQLTLSELTQLGQSIVVKGQTASHDRKVLGAIVSRRYSQARDSGQMNWDQWLELIAVAGEHVPADVKNRMCRAIEWDLIPNRQAIVRLSCEMFDKINSAMLRMQQGGVKPNPQAVQVAKKLCITWLTRSNKYKSMTSEQLARISLTLRIEPGAGGKKARQLLTRHIEQHYLADPTAIRKVSLEDWRSFTNGLCIELSPGERVNWFSRLRAAFAPDHERLASMDIADVLMLAQVLFSVESSHDPEGLAFELTAEFILTTTQWRKASVPDLHMALVQMRLLRETGEQAMTRIEDFFEAYDEFDTWEASDYPVGFRMASYLTEAGREAFAKKVSWAFAELCRTRDDSLREIYWEDFIGLCWRLMQENLSEEDLGVCADALCEAFLTRAQRRSVVSLPDVCVLAAACQRWGEPADDARGRLAGHLFDRLDAGYPIDRGFQYNQWAYIPNKLRGFMSGRRKVAWLAAVLRSVAPDVESVRFLTEPDVAAFVKMADQLNEPAIGEVLRRQWAQARRPLPVPADTISDFLWKDHLLQVRAAPPQRRKQVWNQGLQRLMTAGHRFQSASLNDLGRLAESLSDDTALKPSDVLTDILRAGTNGNAARLGVLGRLCDCMLAEALPSSSPQVRQLLRQADFEAQRLPPRAVSLYLKAIDRFADREHLVSLLRWKLLTVLMAQKNPDVDLVDAQLAAVRRESGALPAEFFDSACRGLMYRVSAAAPEARQAIWAHGIGQLSNEGGCLSPRGLAELDDLLALLGKTGPLTSLEVATDLMLLVPNLESMRGLQARRVSLLRERKAWQEALAAGTLELFMEIALQVDSLNAIAGCADTMREANRTAEYQRAFCAGMCKAKDSGGAGSSCKDALATIGTVDSHLKAKAQKILTADAADLSIRRRAFLMLFAGDTVQALQDLRAIAATQPTDSSCAMDSLADISFALTVQDGHFGDSGRLVRRLANALEMDSRPDARRTEAAAGQPARKQLDETMLAARERAFLVWGTRAPNKEWAAALWSHAIREGDTDQAQRMLDRIADIASHLFKADAVGILVDIAEHKGQTDAGTQASRKAADVAYSQKRYVEYLALCDRIAGRRKASDIAEGLKRGTALIRTAKYAQALSVLDELKPWVGTDEQHAQVLFLVGWTHLQTGERLKAIAAFEDLTEKYPDTRVATKAADLTRDLKAL